METSALTGDHVQEAIQILLNGTFYNNLLIFIITIFLYIFLYYFYIYAMYLFLEIHQPEKLEKSTEAVSNINKGTVLKKDKKGII